MHPFTIVLTPFNNRLADIFLNANLDFQPSGSRKPGGLYSHIQTGMVDDGNQGFGTLGTFYIELAGSLYITPHGCLTRCMTTGRSFLIPLSVLRDEKFGFLTTMRFTHTGRAPSHHDIPLFELHMDRISRAFDHLGFTNGRTIGEMERKRDVARKEVAFQVTSFMSTLEPGDYRVSPIVPPRSRQIVPEYL
jgi:hypothetical protein